MKLRFTPAALQQLDHALDRVARVSTQGAATDRARVADITALLVRYPRLGRETSRPAVRRIAIVPYPYVLDFRADGNEVAILGFRHAARKPLR